MPLAAFPGTGECENALVLTVRAARPADALEVAGVHVRSWQGAYRGLLPDRSLDELRPADRADRYDFGGTDPEAPSTTVAVEDGAICGFATIGLAQRAEATDVGEVLALYVDPVAWGRGVGRLLMSEARAQLGQLGLSEAMLWVLVGNERAQRFYRADGWRPDRGRRNVEVWGVAVEEIRYRRSLS